MARFGHILSTSLIWSALKLSVIAAILVLMRDKTVPAPYLWYAFRPEYYDHTRPEIVAAVCAMLCYLFAREIRHAAGQR